MSDISGGKRPFPPARVKEGVYFKIALEVLNEALELDRDAISALMRSEIPINQALAEHWSIQVGNSVENPERRGYVLRPLGLINGLFGVDKDSYGHIGMLLREDGLISRFVPYPDRDTGNGTG